MKKLNPVERYVKKLKKTMEKNKLIFTGRSFWTFSILLSCKEEYTIREGIKNIQERLEKKGIPVPKPSKKVKDFLDNKTGLP